ncbi:S16 family serine protease [Pseudarthrobacter sp. BRE9]|uniref:YlbL family protein n=1 Tax=Pseudarthrobacter sp. BRE9 TaxID=2962582 RepID=UPI002881DF5F|nr:S16 family serine protease [Pseudarthrobacter sp. BRE9]MDT0167684.1 S16 family serine protease [Pseudarthrobacter sp. BRE9]
MTTTRGGHPSEDHVPDLPPLSNPGPFGAGSPPEGSGDSGGTAVAGSGAGASDDGGPGRRLSTMMVAGLAALGLGIAVGTLPVPYVIESPGPTYNTLGESQGHPVINVSGHETYPAAGSLDLTTVYVDGGPTGSVSVLSAFSAWLDRSKAVYPVELIYPTGTTREEAQEQSAVAMATSQENAVASALNELRIPFGQQLQAADLSRDSASAGKIQQGDILKSINGKDIRALSVIQDELAAGRGAPVSVTVERDGRPVTVEVTPKDNGQGRFILGIMLKYQFSFPFQVQISLDKVGGPSAGLMFSLGIIDTVTPGDLTGGKHVAGTGTISPDGSVGPIGGIGQKMRGARSSGATLFLAPAGNCDEVAGHVPDGLQVVRVENLSDARHAVELAGSGQDTSALPACTSK